MIASTSWRTLPKLPGRIACWLKSRKKRSTRFIQDEPVGVKCSSKRRVARVWARAAIQPHRLRRYMVSTDPEFEEKAADIIGLYVKPPLNAAVFCIDEKSAIQALDRLDPVL